MPRRTAKSRLESASQAPPAPAGGELRPFFLGFWTGVGLTAFIGLVTWATARHVRAERDQRTLPRRMERLSNDETFTSGDFSGIDANAELRAQLRTREETYAARQRNLQAVADSLEMAEWSGRSEVQPWLGSE